jgi:hypothetical protein
VPAPTWLLRTRIIVGLVIGMFAGPVFDWSAFVWWSGSGLVDWVFRSPDDAAIATADVESVEHEIIPFRIACIAEFIPFGVMCVFVWRRRWI